MERDVRPCDISGAFNETATELSDANVATELGLIISSGRAAEKMGMIAFGVFRSILRRAIAR